MTDEAENRTDKAKQEEDSFDTPPWSKELNIIIHVITSPNQNWFMDQALDIIKRKIHQEVQY